MIVAHFPCHLFDDRTQMTQLVHIRPSRFSARSLCSVLEAWLVVKKKNKKKDLKKNYDTNYKSFFPEPTRKDHPVTRSIPRILRH